jgi:hypothetical protein
MTPWTVPGRGGAETGRGGGSGDESEALATAIITVRDVLIARGAEPDPEIEEAAETAIDEPGGAAQT